jgi:hypothetical protein
MLGSQFDRTYWENPETGKTVFYGPADADTRYGTFYDPKGQVSGWSAPLRLLRHQRSEIGMGKGGATWLGAAGTAAHQGLLFHPSTGTGAGRDPLMEDSAPLIRKALRLEDKDNYDRRARFEGPPDYDAASTGAVNAIKRTSMPPHVLSQLNASLTLSPSEGRSHANPVDRGITIKNQYGRPDWDALVHEIGHTMHGWDALDQHADWVKDADEHGRYKGMVGRPDPRSEGLADGISDRFTRLASAHEDLSSLHQQTGYSTQFSGFRDNTGRALYSAARAHASMSDLGITEVPARDDLMRDAGLYHPDHRYVHVITKSGRSVRSMRQDVDLARSKVIADSSANSLLLGHLAHHNPAIVPHLEAQGFGKVTQQSVDMYRQHFPQHAPAPEPAPSEPEYEQLSLDLGKPKRGRK